jgi:DNA polymerase III subunit delta'
VSPSAPADRSPSPPPGDAVEGRPASAAALPGTERHPHAAAMLGPAVAAGGRPSHAYLFHGPAGAGKRIVARELAAALLAEGASSPQTVAERVARGSHPDLTWVRPSGAAEMLVADIEEPVVAAASRTPFESARRVFVIEGAETMNDQAANRLLKTLEEPPPFVHLILLSDRLRDVLPTILSRCQLVRFDPLPAEQIERSLGEIGAERARACARLAMGDAALARRLTAEQGARLRSAAEQFARAALSGTTGGRPWLELLDAGRTAGAEAGERSAELLKSEQELLPAKERKRHEREGLEARRRGERRARTETLEVGLRLAELWLRDLLCLASGAGELIYAVDRRAELEADAERIAGPGVEARLERGIELVAATRLSLAVNVNEELALESLAYEIQELAAAG